MIIKENLSAKDFSTFKIGGTIRYYCDISDNADLMKAIDFAENNKIPLIVIGEGSNTIWKDGENNVLVASFKTDNLSILSEDGDFVIWEIDAGMNWDKLVETSVFRDLSGIECMSGIPGTVGAAPVQNIGSYGQEIKDVLVSVRVYDLIDKTFKTLNNSECNFSYRNSILKTSEKGRYIIVSVNIKLFKKGSKNYSYDSLKKFFGEKNIVNPNLSDIRNAVLEIRSTKLPDPKTMPNCGSFFENPIVNIKVANALKEKYIDLKTFSTEKSDYVKIPAGWLIEKAGFKGKEIGNIVVYNNNSLVLTNKGNVSFANLIEAKDKIVLGVKKMFGIELEMEPNIFN
jgi:UDP-N-acetylmuramate dehydrogenase